MTFLGRAERGPIAAAISGHHLGVALTQTLKLSGPIALPQLGQIAMMTTDLALIRRLGDEAVAAAALAHTGFFITFPFRDGRVSAVARLAGRAFAVRNPRLVRRALRVGLWTALLISLPMMMLPLYGEQILLMLGQAPAIARLAQRYLEGLAWGIAPALWFLAIRGFMGAVNRPAPGLWITLVAIPANAVLVYLLLRGALGLPRLELFGAGLATTTINFGMFLAGLWVAQRRRGGQACGLRRNAARDCLGIHLDAGRDPRAICDRAILLRRGCREWRRRHRTHRDSFDGRWGILCRRRHPDGRGRRASWNE